MIVWKGWGILILPIAMICVAPLAALSSSALGPEFTGLGISVGLALAAVASYLLGQRMNRPVAGYHPATGRPVEYRNQHTLFFLPMQYWGFLLLAGSVAALVTGAMEVF